MSDDILTEEENFWKLLKEMIDFCKYNPEFQYWFNTTGSNQLSKMRNANTDYQKHIYKLGEVKDCNDIKKISQTIMHIFKEEVASHESRN